jgi:RNA polymerase sigma factor (sigma-70 family)
MNRSLDGVGQDLRERVSDRLERLYKEEGDRLWWAVLGYAGDREVASDAVAEAFAQALRRGEDLRDPKAWVWRVAFRIAAGELQQRRRNVELPESSYDMPEPAGLFAALEELSPKQRAAIVLHYVAGYRLKEIAKILGSSKPTVGVHLTRGRWRLRDLLEDADD